MISQHQYARVNCSTLMSHVYTCGPRITANCKGGEGRAACRHTKRSDTLSNVSRDWPFSRNQPLRVPEMNQRRTLDSVM